MGDVRLERLKANARFLASAPGAPDFLKSVSAGNLQINLQAEPAGWKNLILEAGGLPYRCHRANDPFGEWSEKYDPGSGAGLLICLGSGFGYQLPNLMQKLVEATELIIAESRLEALFLLMSELDLGGILPSGARIVYAPEAEQLYEFLQHRIARYGKTPLQFLPLDSFAVSSPGYLEAVVTALQDFSARHNVYIRSLEEQAEVIFDNLLRNLPSLKDSSTAHENCARGEYALIVASGPSTDWNIPLIRAAGELAHIFAVGSAAEPLLLNGIEPDFIVVSDPNPINRTHFPRDKYSAPFIYDLVVPPEIVEKFEGARILCDVGHGLEKLIFEKLPVLELQGWGTVASITLDFCVKAGFEEIAFVGTDYSYLGARAHMGDYRGDATPARELEVLDIHDRPVRTTKSFTEYAAHFERQIEGYAALGKRIFNCCEGGLVRAGEQIRLREFLLRLITRGKTKGSLRGLRSVKPDSRQIAAVIDSIRARISEAVTELNRKAGDTLSLNDWAGLPAAYAFEGLLLDELKALEKRMFSGDASAVIDAKRVVVTRLEELAGFLMDGVRAVARG
jgi:hypothetical protein